MCKVASGMFTLGGWWGMEWQAKVIVLNGGRAWVKPKTSLEGLCWLYNGWYVAKSALWTFGLLKQAATLDIASPDTCQCLKPPFEPFTSPWIHPCYNQPRVSRPKFRLETNSAVVWLYAGGVSLILPDVRFGTVSLDWVTYRYRPTTYIKCNRYKSTCIIFSTVRL